MRLRLRGMSVKGVVSWDQHIAHLQGLLDCIGLPPGRCPELSCCVPSHVARASRPCSDDFVQGCLSFVLGLGVTPMGITSSIKQPTKPLWRSELPALAEAEIPAGAT